MEVEQEEAEIPVKKVAPPQVRLTRPSDEWSRSDFQVQLELELPRTNEDSRPDSQLSHRPEEISSSVYNWVCIGRQTNKQTNNFYNMVCIETYISRGHKSGIKSLVQIPCEKFYTFYN